MRPCPVCGAPNRETARYCQRCRAILAPCPTCGAANRAQARVCGQCGTPLPFCAVCGFRNRPGARFCQRCGAPLKPGPIARPVTPAGRYDTGMLPAQTLLHGRYIIVRRIAQGGMGAVYQATDARLTGKVWAVKEMSDSALAPAERAQAIADFQREAQMLARLDHPNLPKVADLFEERESGKHYLVMEFIAGQTLEKLLEASPAGLPRDRVLRWAEQLCDVLDYLHGQQPPIIYRDLKPANVMEVQGTDTVKLIDFGIARFHKGGQTKDTIVIGTPGYAPPEQYGKEQTDARSDIYALGATLHTLLTGYDPSQKPFHFPDACALNPAIPVELGAALRMATAMRREDRFASAGEFKRALLGLVPLPAPPTPPTLTTTAQPPPPSPAPPPAAQPCLDLSRDRLDFGVVVRGRATLPLSFQVRNTAGGVLSGHLTGAAPWVTCMPAQITRNDETISVEIHPAVLDLGRKQRHAPRILTPIWRLVWKLWWVWLGLLGLLALAGTDYVIAGAVALVMLLGGGLALAGLVQFLTVQVVGLGNRLVPAEKHHRTTVAVQTNGGDQNLHVEVTVVPTTLHRAFGWGVVSVIILAETAILLLLCWWLLAAYWL